MAPYALCGRPGSHPDLTPVDGGRFGGSGHSSRPFSALDSMSGTRTGIRGPAYPDSGLAPADVVRRDCGRAGVMRSYSRNACNPGRVVRIGASKA